MLVRPHQLRSNDAYIAVAWRWASVKISLTERLCNWTLPKRRCIVNDERDAVNGQHFVPVSVSQTALPVFRAVLARASEADERYQWLRELLRQPQHAKWILAQPDATGQWYVVRDERGEQSADVERLEVSANID